jgi:hypothetical protein
MDPGIVIQTLDMRSRVQDFAFDPEPAVPWKVSDLGSVTDGIGEVKVRDTRWDSREATSP